MEPSRIDISSALHERLLACEEQYGLHFAGHPRLTRDPEMLAALIADVRQVASAGNGEVAALANQAAALYEQEKAAIEAALAEASATERAAAHLSRQASLIMHRYTRHFAGQSRHGRDLGLLAEMQDDLLATQRQFASVSAAGAAQVQPYIDMLAQESHAIAKSRAQGTLAQQAAAWGSAANTLLGTYETLCMGRRRLAVRPQLWQRLVDALQPVVTAMRRLQAAGLAMPHHDSALQHMQEQLQGWQDDLADSLEAHTRASDEDRVESLRLELDDLLAAYNDIPVDGPRTQIVACCDRMDELERSLRAVDPTNPHGRVASDALAQFCSRFDAL